ncbi:MAG: tetratricopeptide repeat protein [Terriglobales bacterium]
MNGERATSDLWSSTQAYILAIICLLLGVAVGYLLRGSAGAVSAARPTAATPAAAPAGAAETSAQPTPEQMRRMAEKQAEPLLAQLKQTPNDPELLAKVGDAYYDTQLFQDAIEYYKKSLAARENPNVRTDMGTSYFYLGDADTAIEQLQRVLKTNPAHENALFNLGMVRFQGKTDFAGAIAAWEMFLKQNPNTPRRAEVEQLLARARQHAGLKPGSKTDKPVR